MSGKAALTLLPPYAGAYGAMIGVFIALGVDLDPANAAISAMQVGRRWEDAMLLERLVRHDERKRAQWKRVVERWN